jgi:xylulokinase
MERRLLTCDILTSGVKTSLFSEEGHLLFSETYPLTVHFEGRHAWQDPGEWWRGICETTRHVFDETGGFDPSSVAAVSFTTQVQVCLCVNEKGIPLMPAITWSDIRALETENAIARDLRSEEYYAIAGQLDAPSTSIRKLMWVKEKQRKIYDSTYKMLSCKDFVVFRLTGSFAADASDAGSSGALDVRSKKWSGRILRGAEIDAHKLPEVFPSTHVAGTVTERAAAETGLNAGTKVILGAGDFTCSAVGAGAVKEGDAFLNLGSSSWLAAVSAHPLTSHGMGIVNCVHAIPNLYVPLASVQEAGATFKWLGKILRYDGAPGAASPYENVYPYGGMEALLRQAPPGAGGLLYIPYLLGSSTTHPGSGLGGAFLGLTVDHTAPDMARAALEGVTMDLKLALDSFRKELNIEKIIATGVAAKEKEWLQIIADIFDLPIVPASLDTTVDSVGAAIIAGVGAGIYDSFDLASRFYALEDPILPNPENKELYKSAFSRFQKNIAAL